ncbi:hypothetical protein KAOT1_05037 [Kordia algicida OT-1]|uniref:Uncharacterized protein n=1 Tax=Kordia algicida OT-1 TaxID=391587 RepID=A9DZM1_9FLAO|nr:hypothetical protein KAOT1_05037 [Kordia algicida OT-1]
MTLGNVKVLKYSKNLREAIQKRSDPKAKRSKSEAILKGKAESKSISEPKQKYSADAECDFQDQVVV